MAWKNSGLYVFVGWFWGWPCTKLGNIQKFVIGAPTINQEKYCVYAIHARSIFKHKTQDIQTVQGQGPSNINLSLLVCFFLWCLPGLIAISSIS